MHAPPTTKMMHSPPKQQPTPHPPPPPRRLQHRRQQHRLQQHTPNEQHPALPTGSTRHQLSPSPATLPRGFASRTASSRGHSTRRQWGLAKRPGRAELGRRAIFLDKSIPRGSRQACYAGGGTKADLDGEFLRSKTGVSRAPGALRPAVPAAVLIKQNESASQVNEEIGTF